MSAGKDLFGAEPFDPFTCGAADFPPDIQSKLDEMQVSSRLRLIRPPRCVVAEPVEVWIRPVSPDSLIIGVDSLKLKT